MKVSSYALVFFGLLAGFFVPAAYGMYVGAVSIGALIAYGLFISFFSGSVKAFEEGWFPVSRQIDRLVRAGNQTKPNRYLTLIPISVVCGLIIRLIWAVLRQA